MTCRLLGIVVFVFSHGSWIIVRWNTIRIYDRRKVHVRIVRANRSPLDLVTASGRRFGCTTSKHIAKFCKFRYREKTHRMVITFGILGKIAAYVNTFFLGPLQLLLLNE